MSSAFVSVPLGPRGSVCPIVSVPTLSPHGAAWLLCPRSVTPVVHGVLVLECDQVSVRLLSQPWNRPFLVGPARRGPAG